MNITALSITLAASSGKFTCTASITVRQAANNNGIGGATVSLTWASLSGPICMAGFPYATTAVTATGSKGSVLGVAASTSARITAGLGCKVTVTGVTAPGYAPFITSLSQQQAA
jgi:hypothetical protein